MKMRKLMILMTALMVGFAFTSQAQGKGKVAGTVIDGNAKTIESATITLLRAKDSSVARMSVADKTGKFVFEPVANGKYLVSISAVGHLKGYSDVFELSDANQLVTLKTIELVPQTKSLGEVT